MILKTTLMKKMMFLFHNLLAHIHKMEVSLPLVLSNKMEVWARIEALVYQECLILEVVEWEVGLVVAWEEDLEAWEEDLEDLEEVLEVALVDQEIEKVWDSAFQILKV